MLHFLMKLIMAAMPAAALTGCGGEAEAYPETLTMEVLDVGQGLAVLFSQGERHALFDAGPDSAGIADSLCARGIQRLDWALVSHWHRDHAGGLLDWSAGGPSVDTLFYGPDTAGAWIRDSVFALAHSRGRSRPSRNGPGNGASAAGSSASCGRRTMKNSERTRRASYCR